MNFSFTKYKLYANLEHTLNFRKNMCKTCFRYYKFHTLVTSSLIADDIYLLQN